MKDANLVTKMIWHALDQGEPSLNSEGEVAFRGVGGLMSPVGHLIKDELYNHSLEHFSPSSMIIIGYIESSLNTKVSIRQESVIQEIEMSHKEASKSSNFRKSFAESIQFYVDAAPFELDISSTDAIIQWQDTNGIDLGVSYE